MQLFSCTQAGCGIAMVMRPTPYTFRLEQSFYAYKTTGSTIEQNLFSKYNLTVGRCNRLDPNET